jgi:hypothetical protein
MTVYCFGASQALGADEFPALAPRWAIPIFHPGAICCSRSLRRAQIRRPPFALVASVNRRKLDLDSQFRLLGASAAEFG